MGCVADGSQVVGGRIPGLCEAGSGNPMDGRYLATILFLYRLVMFLFCWSWVAV